MSNYAFGMRFEREKTVQETYNCVLQGLPLLHSLCVENWLSPFHCDLTNNEVAVGVIRFSVFFSIDMTYPFLDFRVGVGQWGFRIEGVKYVGRNLLLAICFG